MKTADSNVEWAKQIAILQNGEDIKAAKQIAKLADVSNVRQLYELLRNKNSFVSEAVAVPLARLEGARALVALFSALKHGEQRGLDNDGLTNTIIGVVESNKDEVAPLLLKKLKSKKTETRVDAIWALGYISSAIEPDIFFDRFIRDTDPEV